MRQFLSTRFRSAFFLFLLFIPLDNCIPAARADYLVVERPQQLVIYNQYQQRVSSSERSRLLSDVPFRILNPHDVLGDGFTRCMKVELGGRAFFLEKDENGTLLGAEGAGARQMYSAAEILEDTIKVLEANRLVVSDMRQSGSADLQEGDRFIRIFRLNGRIYGKLLGANERYGWINLGDASSKDWRIERDLGLSVSDQIQKALPRLEVSLKEVNEKLKNLYDYFNRKFSQRRQPPLWQLQRVGNSISCVLLPDGSGDQSTVSVQLLGKNFEGLLLGTELRVVILPGRLEIRSEAAE